MKKIALIGLIAIFTSQVAMGQEQPLSPDINNRPLIAQELKALSSIARESVRDIQEKYRSFKEELEKITQETNPTRQLTQLIFMVESTAQTLVQEWSKIGYQAGELLESLSALAINETETQKIKDIAQSLKTASRDFDEFRNSVQAKVFPIIEQNLTHIKTLIPEFITPTPEHIPTEPTLEPELPTEPTPEPILVEEQLSTELPTPPAEESVELIPETTEQTPGDEPIQTEPAIEESVPADEPPIGQLDDHEESESLTEPTQMPTEPSQVQEISGQTIDEDIDDLPGSAPEIAQMLNREKIEGASESELKDLLEKKEKNFDEKFPGPEFLTLIGDLNILHAYAKATRDYVNLAKQALEKQDKESVARLQEKINEIKQKYVNKINEINDRYRSTEWYAFYTQ